jgi:two-component sensor histidine kinase
MTPNRLRMNVINLQPNAKIAVPSTEPLCEASHRISNHLGLLMGMVRTQTTGIDQGLENLSREAAKEMLQATAGKCVPVSRLHHWLSEQSHLDGILLSDYVADVCASLVSSLSLSKRVHFVHGWERDCRLSPKQAQYIGLLINEVMVNALKYAHPTALSVQLEIRCEQHANGRVKFIIADDGVDLSEDNGASTGGVGSKLIRALTTALNAELRIESDSLGLMLVITLPTHVDAIKRIPIVAG